MTNFLRTLTVLLMLSITTAKGQVPNNTTFNLQDVQGNITGNPNNLSGCFTNAISNYFDPAYSGSKNSLLNFRNYKYRHYIGESYQGGKIFWLSEDRMSGYIVANTALTDGGNPLIRWFNGFNRAVINTYSVVGTGKDNTNKIIATIGNNGRAAKLCVDYRGGGYNDWFLPSLDELHLALTAVIWTLENSPLDPGDHVWTSSASYNYPTVNALYLHVGYPTEYPEDDDYLQKRVIPIRYFVDAVPYWYNVETSATAQKNDCETGYYGTTEIFTASAGTFMSYVSQADANNQASTYVNTYKQTNANNIGTCIANASYSSAQISESIQKNDCGTGYTGGYYTWTLGAGAGISSISQADADNNARSYYDANKQSVANTYGTCIQNTNVNWSFSNSGSSNSYLTISVNGTNVVNTTTSTYGSTAFNNGDAVIITVHGNDMSNVYSNITVYATGINYTNDKSGFKNVTDTYSFTYSSSNGTVTITTSAGNAI